MTVEVQEDIVDILLRYGLFLGAIFQLFCIGAVIVMPDPKSDSFLDSDASDEDQSDDSPQVSPNHKQYRNVSKKERKKRR